MKKKILGFTIGAIFLLAGPHLSSAQQSEPVTPASSPADKTEPTESVEVEVKQGPTPVREIADYLSEGIKYVPGKNHTGRCEDDDLYTYYIYEQDALGRTARKIGYNVGPNNTKVVSDEYLKYYVNFEYDFKGKLIKDFSYNAKGPDDKWFTADDVENYHSVYGYCHHGKKNKVVRHTLDGNVFDYTTFKINRRGWIIKDVVYKGKGADNTWFTADDVIEKYHRFEYNAKGYLLRAMEYHTKFNGRGADNKWFTADDVISSTKGFIYNDAGMLTQIKKFTLPGPDKKWFTDDDIPQYYTMYHFSGQQGTGTMKPKAP